MKPGTGQRVAVGLLMAATLGATFWLYTRPDFLVLMVNQVWSCF